MRARRGAAPEELADTAVNGFLVAAARWADDENWPLVKEAYFGAMPWPVKAVVPGRIRARVVSAMLAARDVLRAATRRAGRASRRTVDHLEARAPEEGSGSTRLRRPTSRSGQLQSFRMRLTPRQARGREPSRLRCCSTG